MTTDKSQEEIDLLSIFKTITKIILSIIEGALKIFKTTIKNYKTTLVIMLITTSLGIGLFYFTKPIYKSELIILTHKRLGDQTSELLINNIKNLLVDNYNNHTISQMLLMDEVLTSNIKDIQFEAVKISDSLNLKNPNLPFKIIVKIYDNSILPKLQEGLLYYLKNNEYVLSREKINQQYLESTNSQIDKEIISLDSLKSKIIGTLQPKNQGSGININQPIDPVNIYMRELELYSRKFDINIQKQTNSSFDVLQSFTANKHSMTTNFNWMIFMGIISGYVLSFILAIYDFLKTIK